MNNAYLQCCNTCRFSALVPVRLKHTYGRLWKRSTCCSNRDLPFDTRNRPSTSPKCLHTIESRPISKSYLQAYDNVLFSSGHIFSTFYNKQKMQRYWMSDFLPSTPLRKTYEETVKALNGLQSNAATVLRSQKDPELCIRNMNHIKEFLNILDLMQEDLKSLNVIHVAGTKGKGSTCAFTESILRTSGFKTGFFSSPHLVVVRERIRINGKPLSQSDFVSYFWQVYNKLSSVVNQEGKSMPPYFMFLTLMAFHVFLQEKVDVAVIEVGLGGEYDCTNVIKHPSVVGITSIGLDHISLLGDTVEKIAWQKAGILKENVPAYTVRQPPGVMSVFLERATERKCPLYLVPNLGQYNINSKNQFNISAEIQEVNISLALQLCHAWMKRHQIDFKDIYQYKDNSLLLAEPFNISSAYGNGVQNCIWLGRFQKLQKDNIIYFLDGAHTYESVECCAKWFLKASSTELLKHKKSNVFKVLIFNCTRDRKPEGLLSPLVDMYFDLAVFCTNNVQSALDSTSDLSNYNADREKELQQCLNNMNMWQHLQQSCAEEEQFGTHSVTSTSVPMHPSHTLMQHLVSDAIKCLENPKRYSLSANLQEEMIKAEEIHVLVTGSLHLVGSVLSILEPEMHCS